MYLKCKFDSLYELFPKSGNLSKEQDTLHLPRHSMAEGQQNLAVPNVGALSEEGQFPPLTVPYSASARKAHIMYSG